MLLGQKIQIDDLGLRGTVTEASPCVVQGTIDDVEFVMKCTDETVEAFTRKTPSIDFSEVPGNAHLGFEFNELRDTGLSLQQYARKFGESYRKFKKARQDFIVRLDALGIRYEADDEIGWAEYSEFDSTYIDFLQQQIDLNARGNEWTQQLTNRKEALQQFVDKVLLRGTLRLDNANIRYWFDESGAMIHREDY